jgi:hypothetical protein
LRRLVADLLLGVADETDRSWQARPRLAS